MIRVLITLIMENWAQEKVVICALIAVVVIPWTVWISWRIWRGKTARAKLESRLRTSGLSEAEIRVFFARFETATTEEIKAVCDEALKGILAEHERTGSWDFIDKKF
jgi:hypothetical protein